MHQNAKEKGKRHDELDKKKKRVEGLRLLTEELTDCAPKIIRSHLEVILFEGHLTGKSRSKHKKQPCQQSVLQAYFCPNRYLQGCRSVARSYSAGKFTRDQTSNNNHHHNNATYILMHPHRQV